MKHNRKLKFHRIKRILSFATTVGILLSTIPALATPAQASQGFGVGQGKKWPTQANASIVAMGGYYSEEGSHNGGAPAWDSSAIYNEGDVVTWKGDLWQAGWWTTKQEPGTTGQWGVWTKSIDPVDPEPEIPVDPVAPVDPKPPVDPEPEPPVDSSVPKWSTGATYNGGDTVKWNDSVWKASWWTQGEEPGKGGEWGVWKKIGETTPVDPDPEIPVDPDPDPEIPVDPIDPVDPIVPVDPTIPNYVAGRTYTQGQKVNYNGKIYEAKWWTSSIPGSDQSWKEASVIIDPGTGSGDFRVVGYYPNWQPDKIHTIQYDNLTHIVYAFGIPTADGSLLPLENPDTAKQIINEAHKKDVKVMLAIGGWSYKDIPLETTFLSATNSPAKIKKFGDAIVAMAKQHGFDGIDMDWEHPRADGTSKQQYTDLMLYLRKELTKENMLFSAAVLSGVTSDGITLYDAQGHTNEVLNAVDWINVMAYDGGDGDRHSSYDFAVNSANYWKNDRGMPASKVVLGVPFYGRPSWATYEEILAANPDAHMTDVSTIQGKQAHYNGIPTIEKKTQWACDNVGGTMMWELSQDSTDPSKSLLNAMAKIVRKNNK